MKNGIAILMMAAALTVIGCTQRSSLVEDTETIRRVGYYEDFQNSRVVAFEFDPGTSAEQIRAHAEGLSYASERLLAAYYFEEGSRAIDAKTLRWSRTILMANDLFFDTPDLDPWHYAFMRNFLGETLFADCTESVDDPLCRKD